MSTYLRAKALKALRPNSKYHMVADDITWFDDTVAPTEEEILEKIAEIEYEKEVAQYKIDRANMYPSIQDQLDKIYHEGIDSWKAEIQSIKEANPKLSIDEADLENRKSAASFNYKLKKYSEAVERLSQYELSVGRQEIVTDIVLSKEPIVDSNGELIIDSDGIGYNITYYKYPAIEPLPATVTQTEFDSDGNPTQVEVPNPAIVSDEAERAAAQEIINNTEQAVIDHYEELNQ